LGYFFVSTLFEHFRTLNDIAAFVYNSNSTQFQIHLFSASTMMHLWVWTTQILITPHFRWKYIIHLCSVEINKLYFQIIEIRWYSLPGLEHTKQISSIDVFERVCRMLYILHTHISVSNSHMHTYSLSLSFSLSLLLFLSLSVHFFRSHFHQRSWMYWMSSYTQDLWNDP
jgi:hypothetical protein